MDGEKQYLIHKLVLHHHRLVDDLNGDVGVGLPVDAQLDLGEGPLADGALQMILPDRRRISHGWGSISTEELPRAGFCSRHAYTNPTPYCRGGWPQWYLFYCLLGTARQCNGAQEVLRSMNGGTIGIFTWAKERERRGRGGDLLDEGRGREVVEGRKRWNVIWMEGASTSVCISTSS